jgi:hypothetical protein
VTKTQTPAEFDATELAVMQDLAKADRTVDQVVEAAHRKAGDTYGWTSRTAHGWQLSDEEAAELSGLKGTLAAAQYEVEELNRKITAMEQYYRADPWTRWYPCLNADGHIHSSHSDCPTLHRMGQETAMGWETRLSGQPVAVVIAELGPRLCSVCFPEAPAEHCRSLSDITRAGREAARAAKNAERDAKLAVKNLAEPFLASDGDVITTVAAAKAAVRKAAETAVELDWHKSEDGRSKWKGMEDRYNGFLLRMARRLAGEQADATALNEILINREAAAPGTGWTYVEFAKSVRATTARTRKAYFG